MSFCNNICRRAFAVKPMEKFHKEETEETGGLQRNLTLFDLLCVGVGGTIGTGIFVLTGMVHAFQL